MFFGNIGGAAELTTKFQPMNLADLLTTVVQSSSDDWNVIDCWGADSGPSYRNHFEFYETYGESTHIVKVDSHTTVAAFRPDLTVSLAWGLSWKDDFKEPWANGFPDPKATGIFLDLFYMNSLVQRMPLIAVDGGRCYLPIPRLPDLTVARQNSALARLVNSLTGNDSYDTYIQRAGIREQ